MKQRVMTRIIAGTFALGLTFPVTTSANSSIEKRLDNLREKYAFLGDMYDRRNETVPLDVYVCNRDLDQELIGNPTPPVDLAFDDVDIVNLEEWTRQANTYLASMSGGRFQVDLQRIDRGCPKDGVNNGYTMVVAPLYAVGGRYRGGGLFWIDPSLVSLDHGSSNFNLAPLHEMMHGLLGPHTYEVGSITYGISEDVTAAVLFPEEAEYLGWPDPQHAENEKRLGK